MYISKINSIVQNNKGMHDPLYASRKNGRGWNISSSHISNSNPTFFVHILLDAYLK